MILSLDIPVWIWFMAIPSCIAIAFIDYLVFNRWSKCDKCGHENTLWYAWLLPTLLEIFLFLSGVAIGYLGK